MGPHTSRDQTGAPAANAGQTPPQRSTSEAPFDDRAALEAELDRLRTEVATLRAGTTPPPAGRRGVWRQIVVAVLLLLIAVLAPVSVMARWTNWIVSDTDTYVDAVAPLASDPEVQEALAARVTEVVFQYVDVPAVTDQVVGALDERGLPPAASDGLTALSVPLTNAVEGFVQDEVQKFVESDTFRDAWVALNRQAHAQLVVALTGKSDGAVQIEDGTVTLDLGALVDTVKTRLVDQGFTVASKIPSVSTEFVLMQSDELAQAQRGFRLLDAGATVLPIITLLLFALAVAVARNRRRGFIAGALAVATGMVLLGVTLLAARPLYLDALPDRELAQAAAGSFFDALAGFIRTNLRGILIISLVAAFAAWISGPGRHAVGLRRGTSSAVAGVRDWRSRGFGTGAFGEFLGNSRPVIRIGILAGAVLVLLFQSPVTGGDVVATLLVALAVWLVTELLSAAPSGRAEQGLGESAEPAAGSP